MNRAPSYRRTRLEKICGTLAEAQKEAHRIETKFKELIDQRTASLHKGDLTLKERLTETIKVQWTIEMGVEEYRELCKKFRDGFDELDELTRCQGGYPWNEIWDALSNREVFFEAQAKQFKEELEFMSNDKKTITKELQDLQAKVEQQELEEKKKVSKFEEKAEFMGRLILSRISQLEKMVCRGACSKSTLSTEDKNDIEEIERLSPKPDDIERLSPTPNTESKRAEEPIDLDEGGPTQSARSGPSTSNHSKNQEESTRTSRSRSRSNSSQGDPRSRSPSLVRFLLPPGTERTECRTRCVFCNRRHMSNECGEYATVEERERQMDEDRCRRCLNLHRFQSCRRDTKCSFCLRVGVSAYHHAALCPRPTYQYLIERDEDRHPNETRRGEDYRRENRREEDYRRENRREEDHYREYRREDDHHREYRRGNDHQREYRYD